MVKKVQIETLEQKKKRAQKNSKLIQGTIFICLSIFLLAGFFNIVHAGKIKDILKRSRSIFIPPQSREQMIEPARSSIFLSLLETTIISGPAQGSFIQDTRIEFFLDGWQIVPFKKVNRFDVWLVGVDSGWRESNNRIEYTLPPGRKAYTFMARAKDDEGKYDRTAAVRSFNTFTSPYFKKVDITGVNYQGSFEKPNYESLTLYARDVASPVNVTGWKVLIKRKNFSFFIPAAARLLDPKNLLDNDPILLNRGNSLNIFLGKTSPVAVNFQENVCTGYMSKSFESYDGLSVFGCPMPSASDYSHLSLSCRRILGGIGSCQIPELGNFQFGGTTYLTGGDFDCRNFIIRNYNYSSCVERNRDRENFFSGHWRVYLGRTEEVLDDMDDTIYLYDQDGLLVNSYSY